MTAYEQQILNTEKFYDQAIKAAEQEGLEILTSVVPGYEKICLHCTRPYGLTPAEPGTPWRNVPGIAHYLSGEQRIAAL